MRRSHGKFANIDQVPVILDLGHYALKGIVGDDELRRADIRHGLTEIGQHDWLNAVEIGHHEHPDYIQVANRYYEIGQTALNHVSTPVREGTERYHRAYYGVLMCAMIARLFGPGEIRGAIVFASFPPGDRRHKNDLEAALLGKWSFSSQGRDYAITVHRVITYAEPLGGFWNFVIKSDEQGQYDNPEYNPKYQTLVVDLGGGTTSLLPIGPDQLPDYRRAYSYPVGFNNVAEWFMNEARANHRAHFQGSRNIPDSLIHEALATGIFHGGGSELDVQIEVDLALSELVDQFRSGYHRAGGKMAFGQIVLTGGGSIVLGERLKILLDHGRVFYAHDHIDELAFANVTGGLKAYREIAQEIM